MAIRTREILKGWFSTGKYPTQSQFADWIDSFFHVSEDTIEISKVNGLQDALDNLANPTSNPEPINVLDGATGYINILDTTINDGAKVHILVKRNSLAYSQVFDIVYDGTNVHFAPGEINPYIENNEDLDVTFTQEKVSNMVRLNYNNVAGQGATVIKYKIETL